jgi:predicted MPP superfamily phosphohydrolase
MPAGISVGGGKNGRSGGNSKTSNRGRNSKTSNCAKINNRGINGKMPRAAEKRQKVTEMAEYRSENKTEQKKHKAMKKLRGYDPYTENHLKALRALESAGLFVTALYSDYRIARCFSFGQKLPFLIVILALSFFSIWAQSSSRKNPSYTPLYHQRMLVSGIYTAFVIYHMCWLVVFDILFTVVRAFGAPVVHSPFSAAAVILAVACVAAGYRNTKKIVYTRYTIKVRGLKKGEKFRLVQLSDLHIGAIVGKKHMAKAVKMVNECGADAVVVTGDILNRGSIRECADIDEVGEILAGIKSKYGVYCIRGNHDPMDDDPYYIDFIKRCGFTEIDNSSVTVGGVRLIGRTGVLTGQYDRVPLSDLMRESGDTRPVIVLDHDPKGIIEAVENDADLVLSGHTHGGQFAPATLGETVYYGKKFTYGYSKDGSTHSIVSSGVGFFQIPVRLRTKNEIVVIDLVPED